MLSQQIGWDWNIKFPYCTFYFDCRPIEFGVIFIETLMILFFVLKNQKNIDWNAEINKPITTTSTTAAKLRPTVLLIFATRQGEKFGSLRKLRVFD